MPTVQVPLRYRSKFNGIPGILTPPDDGLPLGFDPNENQSQNLDTDPPPIPKPVDDVSRVTLPSENVPKAAQFSKNLSSNILPRRNTETSMPPPIEEPPALPPADRMPQGPPPPAQQPPAGPVPANLKTPTENLAALKPPDAPQENWAQRLGRAVLSLTRFAPAANQIIHPKWSSERRAFETTRSDLEAQQKEEIAAEQAKALEEQRSATAEYKHAQAEQAGSIAEARKYTADQHIIDSITKSGAIQLQPGEAVPNGFHAINGPNGETYAQRSQLTTLPDELVPFFPGMKGGATITLKELEDGWKAARAEKLEKVKGENKPEPAAAAKQEFQGIVTKVASEGNLPPNAMTDVKALTSAIDSSQTLTPEEKSRAKSYLAANTTPAATGTNMVLRMEGLAGSREYPVINKQTGQMEYRSATDINNNKGLYAPAGPGATAMTKEAVFQDLHYNINTARKALQNVEELDAPTRAALSYMLRESDPKSAVTTFLTGQVGQAMTPAQQELVQSLAQLAENAMSLRSIAGMGQGAQDLRDAIRSTIPSGKTPTKPYGLAQLDKFENVVSRLEKGVPTVRTGGAGEKKAPAIGTIEDGHRFKGGDPADSKNWEKVTTK